MNSRLTPRLRAICALVSEGASVIDVGTDHAYVPIHLIKTGRAKRALATDVHDGPVERARENVRRQGMDEKIKLQKADGLAGLPVDSYNTVIIAGMGGRLIAKILNTSANFKDKTLILQPMTAVKELRTYLAANAFRIVQERIVQEDEKLYCILLVTAGHDTPYSEAELLLGRENRNEVLFPILKRQITEKLRKQIAGLTCAKQTDKEALRRLRDMLEEIENIF